jgi:beta-N-acetylhexosaminidase
MLRRLTLVVLLAVSAVAKERPLPPPGPVLLDRGGERWAQRTLRHLTLEEKVGQVIMPWARVQFFNLRSADFLKLRDNIRKYHLGALGVSVPAEGLFVYKKEPYEAAALTNQLQRESKIPLLFAADFERGLSMRLNGTTVFPHAMAFGAAGKTSYAEALGRITAAEARAIGIHWNFFPDADVNSNPANPIINTRSFGEDPEKVGEMVAAYIHGAHSQGLLSTAKHFPGHGDTGTDSHLALAQVGGNAARLESVELPPFRAAIQAGVEAVMIAHVTAPALDAELNHVATTSRAIVDGLLKENLGFRGLVVTDALDMRALTRLYSKDIGQTCVAAFKAGNDMLLIPPDLDACYRSLLAAVRSNEISRRQLDESVLKILRIKASVGLHRGQFVDLHALSHSIAQPESVALGQQVADDAVTLVKDSGKFLPLKNLGTSETALPYTQAEPTAPSGLVVVIMTDDVRLEWGHLFERQIRARAPDATVFFVDPRIAGAMTPDILDAVGEAQKVVAAVYIVPSAGRQVKKSGKLTGSSGLSDATGPLLQQVLERAADKTMVVSLGSPYFISDFPATQNYMCTFSNATVSEMSAIKALFGEMPVHGRLPITIPNFAARGQGLDLPAASGGSEHAQ